MRPIFLLYFPRLSGSVTFRAYLADLGGYNLLEWWVPQLIEATARDTLIALYHDEIDRDPVETIAARHEFLALPTYQMSPLDVYYELAETYPGRPIVTFSPGACLLPPALISGIAEQHTAAQAHFSRVTACPFYCRLEVYDERLLIALQSTNEAACFYNPAGAAEAMNQRKISVAGSALLLHRVEAPGGFQDDPASPLTRFHDCFGVEALGKVTALYREPMDRPATRGLLPEWRQALQNRTFPSYPGTQAADRPHKLRVLYVSDSPGFTGAEQSLCQAVSGVDRSRFEQLGLVSHEGWFATRLRDAGCEVFCPNFSFSTEGAAARRWALDLLRQVRPALIHSNAHPGSSVLAAAVEARVPIVQHARIPSVEDIREPLLQAAAVVTVSRFIAARVEKLGVPPDRIHVVYNPVNTEHFRPGLWPKDEARRALGLPPDAFVLLMVARLAPMKRHEILLRAAVLLRSTPVPVHLVCVGESSHAGYARYIRNLANELDVDSRITWIQFQPDIRLSLAAADLLVLCSKDEPASRAVLEAMAMEVPCVVTHSGGVPEIVEHQRTGLFFPEGDPEALAAAVHDLWSRPEERVRLGENGRREACRRFDHRTAAAAMQTIFERAAAGRFPVDGSAA